MISARLRLQHLQWVGGAAVALCCVVLGAMTLLTSFDDYRHVRGGAEAFERFETVSQTFNAIVAERVPASRLLAEEAPNPADVAALSAARRHTDRLLDLSATVIAGHEDRARTAIYALNEARTHLVGGRLLVDALVRTGAPKRTSNDFRISIDEMFAAASAAEALRDTFGQEVIAISPQVSIEVFLSLAVSALRDQAGRLASYVALAQRENGTKPQTFAIIQGTIGRLQASNRILTTLSRAMPANNPVARRLAEVETSYFGGALRLAMDIASPGGLARADVGAFGARYREGIAAIDGLRDAINTSSRARLKATGDAAYDQAALAGLLTALVCAILLATVLVFRRALFVPLGRALDEARAIARGDLSEPISAKAVGGEIGEMLAVLTAIRDDQRWRRELEEKQAEMARELRHLSETDILTGLLNRRAVEDRARRIFEEGGGGGVAVILFDVDHFKSINDRFGHGEGDEVLRRIAAEVAPLLRPRDSFARFGGEEFILLLPGIEADAARLMAVAICERIVDRVKLPDQSSATASFGVALREAAQATSWETLVATADRRLYAAKRAGRNRVFHSEPAEVCAVA